MVFLCTTKNMGGYALWFSYMFFNIDSWNSPQNYMTNHWLLQLETQTYEYHVLKCIGDTFIITI
jgi:hypothetical protein